MLKSKTFRIFKLIYFIIKYEIKSIIRNYSKKNEKI